MRAIAIILPTLVLFAAPTLGQTTSSFSHQRAATGDARTKTEKAWSFSASVYTYIVPDE